MLQDTSTPTNLEGSTQWQPIQTTVHSGSVPAASSSPPGGRRRSGWFLALIYGVHAMYCKVGSDLSHSDAGVHDGMVRRAFW